VDRYSGFETLKVEIEGPLLTVSLCRPDRLNAIGDGMHEELEAFFAARRGRTGALARSSCAERAARSAPAPTSRSSSSLLRRWAAT